MKDKIFRCILFIGAISIIFLTASIVYNLIRQSISSFSNFGFFSFIFSSEWSPLDEKYGALPFICGTLLTALLAIIFCIPFSLSIALFNGEYFLKKKISTYVSSIVDLLAGVPSIVYGLWGFYTLRPLFTSLGLSEQGLGFLLASSVLAIMIIPYASSLSAEFLSMIPKDLKEGAYSLGATQFEVVRYISLPFVRSGIIASYILALGRALGETMAVTMLIGNTINIPKNLSDTGNTMASIIANQFGEAGGLKLSSLFAIAVLLFLITAIINSIARYTINVINR